MPPAAAIRDPAQIRAYGKQVEAQLADFAQTVKAGSRTELAMLYRLRDMLLSQRAYLTAMTDYTAHGGKSRAPSPGMTTFLKTSGAATARQGTLTE